ncbi:MAG: hypothetical protein CYPHOPRED_000053 [Cyphobasidiales sp. Tagirdzhanova-0007]|nr:MAG: hypothetical protein CYPHOPRED_000053 [Cyphobasidiales sp. Tagirdzhanova-0007]
MEEELEAEELSREREPPTPDVEEEEEAVATPLVPSTSGKQETGGFVFGAATRLGGRTLTEGRDPWTHNAWDNVEWGEDQEIVAREAIQAQKLVPVSPDEQERLNATPERFWDKFYANVADTFFKDRSWLCMEFQPLSDSVQPAASLRGETTGSIPELIVNKNPSLFLHCLDYSQRAVQLVKKNPAYNTEHMLAETWSLCDPSGLSPGVEPESVDVVVLIFVLSALHPNEWQQAMHNIWTMLKPGGKVCFRDYGRNDLTQLRFKSSRYMEPNLYARGDKTRVYFFDKEELVDIMTAPVTGQPEHSLKTVQVGVDRRLLMNRKRQLKMYRVWMQGVFQKPEQAVTAGKDQPRQSRVMQQ